MPGMHARTTTVLVVVATLAAPVRAQFVVSPAGLDLVEGSTASNYPWFDTSPRHHMQIHSDLKGAPMTLKSLAWRKDMFSPANNTTFVVDTEIWLGHTLDFDRCSFVYAQNYTLLPRQLCLPRQIVNLGPLLGTSTPAPFDMVIPLATPFLYLGIASLGWEASMYGGTGPGSFRIDAHMGVATQGTSLQVGKGCTVAGRTSPMTIAPVLPDGGGTFALALYLDFAPANQLAALAIGLTNPSLSLPGFCSPLYTDFAAALPLGVTDATGFFGTISFAGRSAGGPAAWVFPNTFQGAKLFLQAHALDPAAPGVQLANSDGVTITVPNSDRSRVCRITRLFGSDGGATTPYSAFSIGGSISYGVVTRFGY